MKELTTKLETSIREDKRKTKLLEIWNEITGWPPDFHFITHEREYIMHGVLKLNGKHTRRLYLFSDLLLITQRSKYKMHIPLNVSIRGSQLMHRWFQFLGYHLFKVTLLLSHLHSYASLLKHQTNLQKLNGSQQLVRQLRRLLRRDLLKFAESPKYR